MRMTRWFVWCAVLASAVMVVLATVRDASTPRPVPAARVPVVESTTRAELARTVEAMETRVAANPADAEAVLRLASALIRVQRVDSDAEAAVRAESHLRAFLARKPDHYEAQRMLGPVLLSQHRFRDAMREAEKARAIDARDAFNYGVIGDAALEIGDYDRAFDAFDTMGRLKPGPPAYARVAYALELKGDLEGALQYMRMASEGIHSSDAEGQAWHFAQIGHLLALSARAGDAKREFERALLTFPGHPYAVMGLARLQAAAGDYESAMALAVPLHQRAPTPEIAAFIGDLHALRGDTAAAEARYVEAEAMEREGWESEEPQPQALARLLAERGRKTQEALELARTAATKRRDIHTMDALAVASLRAGRLDEALAASNEALRTGTMEPRILHHAALIRERLGDTQGASELRARMKGPCFDCRS